MSEKIKIPVVVVLGHVDHGKSSILEAIKDLRITSKESGGITQHIGAYKIEEHGKEITFIDTPGHEAFCAMRKRGACAADIAVLVIAAEEGIKDQTKEAIKNIQENNIPFVVAINKVDKPEADIEKVKRQLAEREIYLEGSGGKIPFVEVSATEKKGIDHLLEIILLLTEMENLKTETNCLAEGIIIESHLDNNKGPIATLIVRKGTLKQGDFLATKFAFGKAKGLEDFQGKPIKKALPSDPVAVLGFENPPKAGEIFKAYHSLKEAKEKIEEEEKKEVDLADGKNTLPLIIKTDVLGSLEAITHMIDQIPQEKVKTCILKAEPGQVNESDIRKAKTTNAKILCFKTKANKKVQELARREGIKILKFDVVYELKEAVENVLKKMLEPEVVKSVIGKIKILKVFKREKSRQIIGGKVIQGVAGRGAKASVTRKEEEIGKGKINTLQQNKREADNISKGSQCGLLLESDVEIKEGDVLKLYTEEKVKKEL